MKTRFHQKFKSEKRGLLAGALASAIFVLTLSLFFGNLQTYTISIARPALALREEVSERLGNISTNLLKSKEELAKENSDLLKKVAILENKLATLPSLERELAFYRETYEIDGSAERIVGKIISKPPFSPHDYLTLDIGSRQGVRKGSLVENPSGNVLGKVALVKENLSFVVLFSSPDKKTVIALPGGEEAEIIGSGGGNFYLELPKDAPLEKNWVVLESVSQKPLAYISTITTSESNPFKQVYLKLMSDINTLERVLITK